MPSIRDVDAPANPAVVNIDKILSLSRNSAQRVRTLCALCLAFMFLIIGMQFEAIFSHLEKQANMPGLIFRMVMELLVFIMLMFLWRSQTSVFSSIELATDHIREEEERSRIAGLTVAEGVLSADIDGRIIYFNFAAERVFGISAAQVLGQSLTVLMPERFRESHTSGFKRYLSSGVSTVFDKSVEFIGLRSSGEEFPLELSIAHVKQGRFNFFTAVVKDITLRKAAEEKLRVSEEKILKLNDGLELRNDELAASNKELEAFTYSVAHDLRAPLRHIYGFAKILLEDFSAEMGAEAKEYIVDILQDTERMGELIDDLLALAKISRQEVRFEITNLARIVENVQRDLRPDYENREIEWKIDELPFVACDSNLMTQVYANLIANAIKYSRPRKPATIEIGRTTVNGELTLFVRDNGVGFNMKYADKLFGVFQRLHRLEDFEGTGVGLATVQRIIHKHHGRVWAEAEVDKGATFYFTVDTDDAAVQAPKEGEVVNAG